MTRRSVLNRSFSTREKVLMLILVLVVIVACYYFFVIKNVADTKAANESQLQTIQQQIDEQTSLAAARSRMEQELEQLGDVSKLSQVATYDNIRNELDELNALLAGVGTYDVQFGKPELEDQLVRRPVTITYTVPSYDAALELVRALQNGTYRCQITNFTFNGKLLADGSVESVAAVLDVVYFETTRGATNLSGLVQEDDA